MVNRVTCSADRISKLTNPQIEFIIEQVKSKTVNIVNDQSHGTKNSPSSLGILDEDDDIKIFDDSSDSDSDSDYDESMEKIHDELTRKEMARIKAVRG